MKSSSSSKKLKKISRENIAPEEFKDFLDNLSTEGDRGAAILAATMLEALLEELLTTKMRPLNKSQKSVLFDGDSPLATFSAKIKIAHAFSIISDDVCANLDLIREIRNAFAHAKRNLSFSTKEVSDVCARLRLLDRLPGVSKLDARSKYLGVASVLCVILVSIMNPDSLKQ
jgi:DNA-binding MltR family transcriptional regulator